MSCFRIRILRSYNCTHILGLFERVRLRTLIVACNKACNSIGRVINNYFEFIIFISAGNNFMNGVPDYDFVCFILSRNCFSIIN